MVDNTLMIYMADHGHPLGDQGYLKKVKHFLYNELVQIPFMVRHPGGWGAGERRRAITETPDVMPTILDALEVEAPDTVQGKSVLSVLKGEKERVREYAYCGHYGRSWAIKNEDWSLILYLKPDVDGKSGVELFDLRKDPGERKNVAGEHREVACEMELELRRFVAKLRNEPVPKDAEVPRRWVIEG